MCKGRLAALSESGFVVFDNVLSRETTAQLQVDLVRFFATAVGTQLPNLHSNTHRAGIRSDVISG